MVKHKIVILVLAILFWISPVVAQEWYKIYEDAKKEMERYDWESAAILLERVIVTKRSPNLHATTYGVNVIEYLPYFHLGQAYFYSGQYKKAFENFQLSENYEVIKQLPSRYSLLISLKSASHQLNQPSLSILAGQKLTEQDSILIGLILIEKYGEALKYLQNLSSGKKFAGSENLAKKDSIIETKNAIIAEKNAAISFQQQFNQCLEPYLLGNYQLSLTRLSELLNQYPQNYQVINWIKKIKSELDLLQIQKQPEIERIVTEKIVSQTASPVFLVRTPETVRSGKISIAGIVGDDNGIDRIEVTVNGVILADQYGNPFQLQPSTEHNPQSFEFGIDNIPLQMGKNQITLIAFDVDSVQHSEFYPLTVIRKLPIYKTTAFYIISISLLLFTIGIAIISRIIKYRIAVVNKYNPYIAGAPILNEEMFFGRKQLLKSIMNTLHHNSLMIYGPRRIGKTSIQHQLKRKLENLDDSEYKYIPIYIDLQGIPEGKFFLSMIEDIVNGCKNYLNDETVLDFDYSKTDGSYDGRDFNRDLRKLITQLCNQSNKELRLVLLMDEVDELNSYSDRVNQRLRSVFMKSFAENLVAVMSGTHIRKQWESEGSPWYNFFEEIEIPPLRKEDAIALIKNPVKGIFSYDDLAIEKIIQYSQCYPYVIQKFCIYAINLIIESKRRKVTAEDVEIVQKQVMEERD